MMTYNICSVLLTDIIEYLREQECLESLFFISHQHGFNRLLLGHGCHINPIHHNKYTLNTVLKAHGMFFWNIP